MAGFLAAGFGSVADASTVGKASKPKAIIAPTVVVTRFLLTLTSCHNAPSSVSNSVVQSKPI